MSTPVEHSNPAEHDSHPVRGYSASKDQLTKRLARIEGQVRGISRMVDEDRYCIDVLTQISAVQAALDKVALGLLDDHARTCVIGGKAGQQDERAGEVMGAVGRPGRRSRGVAPPTPHRGPRPPPPAAAPPRTGGAGR